MNVWARALRPRAGIAPVAKPGKPRHVPDLAVVGVVVVRVEPSVVQELAAAGAAVVVLTPAVRPHDEAVEPRVRIEALAPPVAARRAAHESRGDSVHLPAREPDDLVAGGGPSALRQVAEDAAAVILPAEKRFEPSTALGELRRFGEVIAWRQLTGHEHDPPRVLAGRLRLARVEDVPAE